MAHPTGQLQAHLSAQASTALSIIATWSPLVTAMLLRAAAFLRPHAGAVFATTIFLSATLLFSVQPMVAKMALPHLGGTPAVWAVSMCVFQGLLLAGYCYAHLLGSRAASSTQVGVHLGLLAIAACTLPFAMPQGLASPESGGYYNWLIGVLLTVIGLPFLALSANAPLMQKWYAGLGRPDSHDPYGLYAASNAGSLMALLAYPLVIEPMATLKTQRFVWAIGFGLLMLAIAACGLLLATAEKPVQRTVDTGGGVHRSSPHQRLGWIALSLIPSGLLVAYTNVLTTDIASAPLLWVLPLAIYLATFLVVFRERALISLKTLLLLLVISVAVTLIGIEWVNQK